MHYSLKYHYLYTCMLANSYFHFKISVVLYKLQAVFYSQKSVSHDQLQFTQSLRVANSRHTFSFQLAPVMPSRAVTDTAFGKEKKLTHVKSCTYIQSKLTLRNNLTSFILPFTQNTISTDLATRLAIQTKKLDNIFQGLQRRIFISRIID